MLTLNGARYFRTELNQRNTKLWRYYTTRCAIDSDYRDNTCKPLFSLVTHRDKETQCQKRKYHFRYGMKNDR